MIAKSICAALTQPSWQFWCLPSAGTRHARGRPDRDLRGRLLLVRGAAFDEVDGVTETISGHAGGTKPKPNYGDHEGYYEAVKVTYDPAKVTYAALLDHFWRNIDPFDPNGQFCDKGSAYHAAVFVGDDEEKRLAETTKEEIVKRFSKPVVTEIKPVTTFTAAEDYHRITTTRIGELQVLQIWLRPRSAARRDLASRAECIKSPRGGT
jgi:peptide-methionine (S)-S-oxide reductase